MKCLRSGVLALVAFLTLPGLAAQLSTPTFQPAPGPYKGWKLTVSINCANPGATIFYTTDGSEPNPNSTQYSGPITFTGTPTLKARAYKFGMTESAVGSAVYRPEAALRPLPAPVIQPPPFTFNAPVVVGAACGEIGAVIRYTSNGSEPTASSPVFPGKLTISETTTVKARAFKAGMTDSPVTTAIYLRGKLQQVPAPVLAPPRERFVPPFAVTLRSSESGAEIRYTLDGSEPTAGSPKYGEPIRLTETKTIKARAFKTGMAPSDVVTGVYEKDDKPIFRPVLDPKSTRFTPPFEVLMGRDDPQAEIRYTLDGSEPTSSSQRYTQPIRLTDTTTIKARTFKAGRTPSEVVTEVYTREALRQVPAPVLDPPAKSFTPPFAVTLRSSESGAEIRYTLDGNEPTVGSPKYGGPIPLSDTKTIKVRAFKAGMAPSAVVTGTYTKLAVTPTPAFGIVTADERTKSAYECEKLLFLQKEVERIQKEMERIRKERAERRKKLGLDPDPDCRMR